MVIKRPVHRGQLIGSILSKYVELGDKAVSPKNSKTRNDEVRQQTKDILLGRKMKRRYGHRWRAGGLFLVIGLIVPLIGLFFAIFMIANVIMKKRKMSAAYIATGKASYEIDITYLILSIILIVLGAGALSVDSLVGILW